MLVLAVNDSEEAMRSFVEDGGWSFPVMLGGDSAASAYKVPAIPTVFVIDADGTIVRKLIGSATAAQLIELVEGLAQ